jgi:hypothetical protein
MSDLHRDPPPQLYSRFTRKLDGDESLLSW